MAYIIRVVVMFFVTWTGIRMLGRKSISEMTLYDLAAVMLMTTIASEPLVYKITSKSIVGVYVLVIITSIIGRLSLKKFFYKIDLEPILMISEGKIIEKSLKKAEMNLPLLLSELRLAGFQDLTDIKYAYLEPSGKLSIISKAESRPLTPETMGIKAPPVNLMFPLIINGEIDQMNLDFLQKDKKWLLKQLEKFSVRDIKEVLLAQYDTSGNLVVNLKNQDFKVPEII